MGYHDFDELIGYNAIEENLVSFRHAIKVR